MRVPKSDCYVACEMCHHCQFIDDHVDEDGNEVAYCNFYNDFVYPDNYCENLYHIELPLLKIV